MSEHRYLVCYDIADPKRARRVRKYVYTFAVGGQKSALEVVLSARELGALTRQLSEALASPDRVHIFRYRHEPVAWGRHTDLPWGPGGVVL